MNWWQVKSWNSTPGGWLSGYRDAWSLLEWNRRRIKRRGNASLGEGRQACFTSHYPTGHSIKRPESPGASAPKVWRILAHGFSQWIADPASLRAPQIALPMPRLQACRRDPWSRGSPLRRVLQMRVIATIQIMVRRRQYACESTLGVRSGPSLGSSLARSPRQSPG